MKKFFLGFFVTFPVIAEVIPLEKFDQTKLHQLLSRIPSALTKQEKMGSFIRHFYTYPKSGGLKINCEADFYSGYSLPSNYLCHMDMDTSLGQGDEIVLKVTDSETVQNFYKAISYGSEIKKFYSEERMKGTRADGSFGQIFRYIFICTTKNCHFKLTPKAAEI